MAKHCKGVSEETTKSVLKSVIGRRVKVCKVLGCCQSAKWFADEKEDTGLQATENSNFFRIASSIKSLKQ